MISLKRIALTLSLIFVTGAAQAVPMTTDIDMPLTIGHWAISGGGYYNNIGQDYSSFALQPKAEYFIMDRLSVGGALGLYFSKRGEGTSFEFRQFTIAPSGTYYFWTDAGMALYVNQQVSLNFYNSGSGIGGKTAVGCAFFLNPSIAISPELQAVYADKERGAINIVAMISAYL